MRTSSLSEKRSWENHHEKTAPRSSPGAGAGCGWLLEAPGNRLLEETIEKELD
jgi:hypothetical protein